MSRIYHELCQRRNTKRRAKVIFIIAFIAVNLSLYAFYTHETPNAEAYSSVVHDAPKYGTKAHMTMVANEFLGTGLDWQLYY